MNSDGVPPMPRRAASDIQAEPDNAQSVLDELFDADTLYALRAAAGAYASQAGLPTGRCVDLVIAVHELAANAVRHGGGAGRVRIWNVAAVLQCRVTDDGPKQHQGNGDDLAGAAETVPQNLAARWPYEQGHGLWIVRQIADELSVHSGPWGTIATVTFALPAPGPGHPATAPSRPATTAPSWR